MCHHYQYYMGRRPVRHARMRIYTRIGVFRLLGTVFGTTEWHELSPKFERKHQTDKCDGEGDNSTAKEQESARSKLVPKLVPQEIDEIHPGMQVFKVLEQWNKNIPKDFYEENRKKRKHGYAYTHAYNI